MLVVACQNQSGPSSVRWAQPTNLQHIARDLVGCDHELFCNPANRNSTCFTTHQCFFSPDGIEGLTSEEYTQTLLRPFNKSKNMHYNGLQKALFDGTKHRFLLVKLETHPLTGTLVAPPSAACLTCASWLH